MFFMILLVIAGSYVTIWTISPDAEHENVMATQGIRLVNSIVVNRQDNSTENVVIKNGVLFVSTDGKLFEVNEIRKTYSNEIYIIASYKKLTNYLSYKEYLAGSFVKKQAYKLNVFIIDRIPVTNVEISEFYTKYALELKQKKQIMYRLGEIEIRQSPISGTDE